MSIRSFDRADVIVPNEDTLDIDRQRMNLRGKRSRDCYPKLRPALERLHVGWRR